MNGIARYKVLYVCIINIMLEIKTVPLAIRRYPSRHLLMRNNIMKQTTLKISNRYNATLLSKYLQKLKTGSTNILNWRSINNERDKCRDICRQTYFVIDATNHF